MNYRIVHKRNDVSRQVPCLEEKVSKAVVQGIKFNDFTHWKLEKDGVCLQYLLELGGGFRLYATLPSCFMGLTRFMFLFNGSHSMLCFESKDYYINDQSIVFNSWGNHLTLELGIDIVDYATHYRRPRKKMIWENFHGDKVKLDAYRSKGEYWGSSEDWNESGFNDELKDALLKAVIARDFSGLEEDFRDIEGTLAGPANLLFRYVDDARYSTDVECIVSSLKTIPVSFWLRGSLTKDSDGIVSRGNLAAFTLKIADEDFEAFYNRHPEIPTTRRYLDENPSPSFADAVNDIEELRALVSTDS